MNDVIHCMARCTVCEWKEDDYKAARRRAYRHHRDTGHFVTGEEMIRFEFGSPTTPKVSVDNDALS